jgi:hypothetical protein
MRLTLLVVLALVGCNGNLADGVRPIGSPPPAGRQRQLTTEEWQAQQAAEAESRARWGAALRGIGAAYSQPQPVYQPTTYNCRPDGLGGVICSQRPY